jgi:hypothetical protein
VDGVFGSTTQAAVMAFQAGEHLAPSGMLWTADWRRLFLRRTHPRRSLIPVSKPRFDETIWELDYDERFLCVLRRMSTRDARELFERLSNELPSEDVDALVAYCLDVIAGGSAGLQRRRQSGPRLEARVGEYVESSLAAFAWQFIDATGDEHIRNAALLLTDLTRVISFEDLFRIVRQPVISGGGSGAKEEGSSEEGPRKRQPARRPQPAPEKDELDDVDQDQQAASLEAAAENGAPFCEKCEELRRKQQSA